MRRIITALAVAGVLGGAVFGAAASLGGFTNNPSLGAEDAIVEGCDEDGVGLNYGLGQQAGFTRVMVVILRDVSQNCGGQNLAVTLTHDPDGPGPLEPLPIGVAATFVPTPVPDPLVVPFVEPFPTAHDVDDVHLWIQGF